MDPQVLLTCILSSAAAATVITSVKELILWRLNRKAHKEDKAEERAEEKANKKASDLSEELQKHETEANELHEKVLSKLDEISDRLDIHKASHKLMLSYTIRQLGLQYLEDEEISVEDRKELIHMWNMYHYDLGGNGTHDDLMAEVRKLPTKTSSSD